MRKSIAIALMVLGGLMMAYTGINFVTKEKVVDIGPIEINKDKNHVVLWSPIVGGVLFFGGLVLLFTEKKSRG
jgi:hypothetical protein